MINTIVGLTLYFLMVWGIVDIGSKIIKRFKAHRAKQSSSTFHEVEPILFRRTYYDYEFSASGNHFTISASDSSEAWERARQLVESTENLRLIKISGPHWEIQTKSGGEQIGRLLRR